MHRISLRGDDLAGCSTALTKVAQRLALPVALLLLNPPLDLPAQIRLRTHNFLSCTLCVAAVAVVVDEPQGAGRAVRPLLPRPAGCLSPDLCQILSSALSLSHSPRQRTMTSQSSVQWRLNSPTRLRGAVLPPGTSAPAVKAPPGGSVATFPAAASCTLAPSISSAIS